MHLEVIEHEFNAAPFPIYTLGEAFTSRTGRHIGLDLAAFGMDITGNKLRWFLDGKTWRHAVDRTAEKLESEPNWIDRIQDGIRASCQTLWETTSRWANADLSDMTNDELWHHYSTFIAQLTDTFEWGTLPVLIDFHPPRLSSRLQAIAKRRFGHGSADAFATLTTNVEDLTFQKQEELDFFRLLALPQNELDQAVEKHAQTYGFLSYGYRGPLTWTKKYFEQMVQTARKQHLDPEEKLRQHEMEKKKTLEKILQLETHLDPEEKVWFQTARKLVYIKPWRKEMQIRTYPLAERLLREIARRLDVPMEATRYVTETEMKAALMDGKVNPELLLERKKRCLVLSQNGRTTILVGADADAIASTIQEEDVPKTDTLQGTPATVGKVTAKACIVNTAEDMEKMQAGDILLSVATNPVLMPAIRIASAIVTDQGGLTCHAAIVSREFGIPCIVGTRTATRVFKDGDLLDVDAHAGVVKKV